MNVIALDVGTKTIGVAKGRTETEITQPLLTLKRKSVKKDVRQLLSICQEHGIEQIVVGLPLELDGVEGRSARLARQVGDGLQAISGLPLAYQDERYSTVEAERRLRIAGRSAHDMKSVIDQVAAMVILEDWLAGLKPKRST